eukprot:3843328-Rhodomonas_salina.2
MIPHSQARLDSGARPTPTLRANWCSGIVYLSTEQSRSACVRRYEHGLSLYRMRTQHGTSITYALATTLMGA